MSFFKIHGDHVKAICTILEAAIPPAIKEAINLLQELGKLEPVAEVAQDVVHEVGSLFKHQDSHPVNK